MGKRGFWRKSLTITGEEYPLLSDKLLGPIGVDHLYPGMGFARKMTETRNLRVIIVISVKYTDRDASFIITWI